MLAPDTAAVSVYNHSTNSEPHTHSLSASRVHGFKNRLKSLRSNAYPPICDTDANMFVGVTVDRNADHLVGQILLVGHAHHSVAEQIYQHQLNL